jgi:hypothetical protein
VASLSDTKSGPFVPDQKSSFAVPEQAIETSLSFMRQITGTSGRQGTGSFVPVGREKLPSPGGQAIRQLATSSVR